MHVEAPAKVNLFLRVLAREEEGHHQLETLYAAVDFTDRVTVERSSEGIELIVEGAELGAAEENLAHRAARAFFEHVGGGGARIELEKRIPPRGGLGGGSSNAAAVLRALNHLHGDPMKTDELVELGAGLGADVPFFLSPTTLALAWGRGDRLLSLPSLPSRPVLLVLPTEGVGTAEAYARLAEVRGEGGWSALATGCSRLLSPEGLASWETIAALAENDFHETVFPDRPDLERGHETLQGTEPLLSLLSGSGASLFAVYGGEEAARAARDRVAEVLGGPEGPEGAGLHLTRTLEHPPRLVVSE